MRNQQFHKALSGITLCCISVLMMCSSRLFAQAQPSQKQIQEQIIKMAQPHPKGKEEQRYNIDAKRMVEDINSDDALPRSREFKRIDSTYYVGWMFEGVYKYNHAEDYLGFKNAEAPLERALYLLERDYKKELSTRTNNIIEYIPAYRFQLDYTMIAYYLMNCYSNTERPDKVFTLMHRVLKWNFQREYYVDAYDFLAWTVHRNRFYTSAQYPFLKNSIAANEKLANSYLDSELRRIAINKRLNAQVFQPGYDKPEKMSVYHYKNILYSYAFKIDSAQHYFDLMRGSGIFPHNNYATFRAICGDFRTAEKEYKLAQQQDNGDKRLKEWAYYTSILDIYKAEPKVGAELMKDMIKANGSTPGFGWYNIALARCMLYDGDVSESVRYINKAAEFKELHIGTTLTQSYYDFSIQLIKLMNKLHEWQAQKFIHRNWWYNPKVLADMSQLLGEKYLQQFLIINQFSQNPERDRVVYKLFSTESTVTWDGIWYLIRDFSTNFFLDKFKYEAQTDNRRYIHKYFQYFVAKLEIKEGNYTIARSMLDAILQEPDIDLEYEKLFVARVYQAEAECADHRDDRQAYNTWMNKMYQLDPQLIPFTGLVMNMHLHISGTVDQDVVDRLKDCNINWVTDSSVPAPDAYIVFKQNGKDKDVAYYVLDNNGNTIVPRHGFVYNNQRDAGVTLAYRLFKIGGQQPEQGKDKP